MSGVPAQTRELKAVEPAPNEPVTAAANPVATPEPTPAEVEAALPLLDSVPATEQHAGLPTVLGANPVGFGAKAIAAGAAATKALQSVGKTVNAKLEETGISQKTSSFFSSVSKGFTDSAASLKKTADEKGITEKVTAAQAKVSQSASEATAAIKKKSEESGLTAKLQQTSTAAQTKLEQSGIRSKSSELGKSAESTLAKSLAPAPASVAVALTSPTVDKFAPGDRVQVRMPNGRILIAEVPAGVEPAGIFVVTVP